MDFVIGTAVVTEENNLFLFLDPFANLGKATVSFVISVCSPLTSLSYWTYVHAI